MNSESSDNFFYRYRVSSNEPLTEASHKRKLRKAQNHPTTHLLFDFTQCDNITAIDFKIISQTSIFKINFLIRAHDYQKFQNLFLVKDKDLFIFLQNKADTQSYNQLNLNLKIIATPLTSTDFKAIIENIHQKDLLYWSFLPYQSKIKNALTLKEIYQSQIQFQTLQGLEIFNSDIPNHYELEALTPLQWQFETPKKDLRLSVIIPSFNHVAFLSNVLQHLIKQSLSSELYEIIVVEDGGLDRTTEIIHNLLSSFKNQINLKFIYWPKTHPMRGSQAFFRAGLARNLAVQFVESPLLVFLDSDMLVPENFIEVCLEKLKTHDLIQFQRFHINQSLSQKNPTYSQIHISEDTYIEEKNYWSQLFYCQDWMSLAHYWKYTCTYGLGMSLQNFLKVGRFKKYYVSYGFEDTDLGYEFYKRGLNCYLVKLPLLHLTHYDQMQYKNSQIKRLKLLRKTAALFYLQHLNPAIYEHFGNFFRFEKKITHTIRDIF